MQKSAVAAACRGLAKASSHRPSQRLLAFSGWQKLAQAVGPDTLYYGTPTQIPKHTIASARAGHGVGSVGGAALAGVLARKGFKAGRYGTILAVLGGMAAGGAAGAVTGAGVGAVADARAGNTL